MIKIYIIIIIILIIFILLYYLYNYNNIDIEDTIINNIIDNIKLQIIPSINNSQIALNEYNNNINYYSKSPYKLFGGGLNGPLVTYWILNLNLIKEYSNLPTDSIINIKVKQKYFTDPILRNVFNPITLASTIKNGQADWTELYNKIIINGKDTQSWALFSKILLNNGWNPLACSATNYRIQQGIFNPYTDSLCESGSVPTLPAFIISSNSNIDTLNKQFNTANIQIKNAKVDIQNITNNIINANNNLNTAKQNAKNIINIAQTSANNKYINIINSNNIINNKLITNIKNNSPIAIAQAISQISTQAAIQAVNQSKIDQLAKQASQIAAQSALQASEQANSLVNIKINNQTKAQTTANTATYTYTQEAITAKSLSDARDKNILDLANKRNTDNITNIQLYTSANAIQDNYINNTILQINIAKETLAKSLNTKNIKKNIKKI